MCQDCAAGFGARQEIEFLRRYLGEQEDRLKKTPADAELRAEIQRTRDLIVHLEETAR